MKLLFLNILLIVSLFFIGCKENENGPITAGVKGTVKVGAGDCMPFINEASRVYSNYNGTIYFILKSDLTNSGSADFDQLKEKSIKTAVLNGKLMIELPVNTYVVMAEEFYLNTLDNTITIEKNVILEKDFKLWRCLAY
jgi:hypothetical protein